MHPNEARTLPIRIEPRPGESIASYINGCSSQLNVPPLQLLVRTGLRTGGRGYRWLPGWGVTLSKYAMDRFSYVTRLPRDLVSDMLLSYYDGVAIDLSGLPPGKSPNWGHVAQRQWAYFTGSHVCPSCLDETGGAYQLKWKLPWSFACAKHSCLLVDTCPSCQERISLEERSCHTFSAASVLLDPAACRRLLAGGTGPARKSGRVRCGYPLQTAKAQFLLRWPKVLEAQRRVDEALKGKPQSVLGKPMPSPHYFADLRSLCAMLLYMGVPEELGEAPQEIKDAFFSHVQERERIRKVRLAEISAGIRYPELRVKQMYQHTPRSAALMAAVTPTAVDMLGASSRDELAHRLQPFVGRVREFTRMSPGQVFRETLFFSPHLLTAVADSHRALKWRVRWQVSPSREETFDGSLAELTPDLVPQLLWEEAYLELFADITSGVRDYQARRICSMALLKITGRYTWLMAAQELEMPPHQDSAVADLMSILYKDDATDTFRERLRELAHRTIDNPDPVNYGFRRRLLARFTAITPEDWVRLCADAEVRPDEDGLALRAATWIWCHLTGGDPRLSPMIKLAFSKPSHVRQRNCHLDVPDSLRCVLHDYAATLLNKLNWAPRDPPGLPTPGRPPFDLPK